MPNEKQGRIATVGRWIPRARAVVVFTGAGISTESGIPDFRSPGGLWSKYDPEEFTYQRFLASERARQLYWRMSNDLYRLLQRVEPNPAHMAIVEIEKAGNLIALITQNVDGLHQIAGSSPELVIELHGTARTASCLSCGSGYDRDDLIKQMETRTQAPRCDRCQGLLKSDTISFGQDMPRDELLRSQSVSEQCDLFIVVGTSLVVQPAASLPLIAKQKGARLVIVNREATPLDHTADAVIHGSAATILPQLLSTAT